MFVAGKSKGKGKGKGKGRPHGSQSDLSDVDVSPLVYDDLLSTYLSGRSLSPESGTTSASSSGQTGIPPMQSLVSLQNDLKILSLKAQARLARTHKFLRSVEAQRAKAVAAMAAMAHEADAESARVAEATRAAAEETERVRKRKADEISEETVVKEEEPDKAVVETQPDNLDDPADTRVKNPGSEYVGVQVIPNSAFSFDDIPVSGEDDLKKKYGVASYPTKDLSDLLPGEIPDEDFSKAKPTNQVQFATFQAFIEPYFRPFVEEDLSFLNEKQDNLTPYLIPPLGPNYQDVWADEDGGSSFSPAPAPRSTSLNQLMPHGSSENLNEDMLETEDISCGPLASRILAALLKDEADDTILPTSTTTTPAPSAAAAAKEDETPDAPQVLSSSSAFAEQQGWRVVSVKADYQTLEDRLRREFKYVGILADDDVDWSAREDDEICAELRTLQARLKTMSATNARRKKRLEKIVHEHMAYAEYTQILEDLDKQVDQAYMKRTRTIKNKKKRPSGVAPGPAPSTRTADLGEGIKALLDKRKRWIEKIGPVFPPPEVMKRVPKKPIFDDDANDEKPAATEDKSAS